MSYKVVEANGTFAIDINGEVVFPRQKPYGIEMALRQAMIGREAAQQECLCSLCSKDMMGEEFTDEASAREFLITFLCQECQDKVWAFMKENE